METTAPKTNLLDLDLHELIVDAANDPWLAEVSARRILPHTVRVSVRELIPVPSAAAPRTGTAAESAAEAEVCHGIG